MGRDLQLNAVPQRIISLVPSQTELLFDLQLNEEIVGVTQYCVHPKQAINEKSFVGGTKQVRIEKIRVLNPDLVIANKEENDESSIRAIEGEFPVWVSDIKDLKDAIEMIRTLGILLDRKERSLAIADKIESSFQYITPVVNEAAKNRAAYLIWRKPWMSIGSDTFIHDMMKRAGFVNVFADKKRYPEFSLEELADCSPDYILLSSEPYPFKNRHIEELQEYCPKAKIELVDGEMFSWYGSRLLQVPAYFESLRTHFE